MSRLTVIPREPAQTAAPSRTELAEALRAQIAGKAKTARRLMTALNLADARTEKTVTHATSHVTP